MSLFLQTFHHQYPVAYTMAVVYRILGEAALKLLSNKIDKAKIVDAATWGKSKRLRIPAFDSCDTQSQLFTHLRDLVLEDRRLRKVLAAVPNIMPWRNSYQYFASRPRRFNPNIMANLASMYQDDITDLERNKIRALCSSLTDATEFQRTRNEKMKLLAVSSLMCLFVLNSMLLQCAQT